MRATWVSTVALLICSTAVAAEAVLEPKLALSELAAAPAIPTGLQVKEPLRIRDFLAEFELTSDHGKLPVVGIDSLSIRLAEQQALDRLIELESHPHLADALSEHALPAPAADPRTEGMRGRGPARFYRSREDQLVRNLAALERPMLKLAMLDSHNATLRALSQQLAIDPYTTHPLLRVRLDRLVTAMLADQQLADAVMEVAVAPEHPESTIDPQLWQHSPAQLVQMGMQRMMATGVAHRASQRFFANPFVSPSLALQWLDAHEALGPMPGADAMVMLGVAAESEGEIRMLISQLQWAGQYQHKDDPLVAFNVQRQAPSFRTRANRIVVLLPVAYLSWTEPFAEFAQRPDMIGSEKIIWISGHASPAALAGLKAADWQVRTAVAFDPVASSKAE